MADERSKAIDLAFAQIEKQFGKGSIMRLGSKEAIVPISVIPTGAISFDAALGVGGFPRGPGGRDLRAGIFGQNDDRAAGGRRGAEKRRHGGVYRCGARAGSRRMPRNWAWTWTTCWFRSRTTASRRWRSPRRWCARARSTCWWWIRWRRWCPRPNSTARWATATWDCRRG